MHFWIGSGKIRPKYKIIFSLFSDLLWGVPYFCVYKSTKVPYKGNLIVKNLMYADVIFALGGSVFLCLKVQRSPIREI